MKWNWVTLQVSDLEKSMNFYTELLKLPVSSRFGPEDHQIVMLGDEDQPKLELIWEPGVKVEAAGKGISMGWEIEELDQMVQTLKEAGNPVQGPISPNPHIRFFFVEDPDGYRIQLVEQK